MAVCGAWFSAGIWTGGGAPALADAPASVAEISVPASVRTYGQRMPKFDNGHLVLYNRSSLSSDPLRLEVLAPGAAPVTWKAQDALGRYLRVSDVAVASDGSGVAATGAWAGSEDREFRVYVFDPLGRLVHSFSTNPYACNLVTLDSTGAIVCFGALGNRDDNPRADIGVFRRYSRDGKLLGEHVPRSSFPGDAPSSSTRRHAFSFLTATSEGVAAYNEPTDEWIELAKDGTLLSRDRLEIPDTINVDAFARIEDGSVLFQDSSLRLYRWLPKSGPPVAGPQWKFRLRGGFGNRLAIEDWSGGVGRIRFVDPPTE